MGLTDSWVAIPADDALRRTFAETDLDDRAWEPITVPGHWQSQAAFRDNHGPLLHRNRFDHPLPSAGTRRFLCFDGLFYQGDVWLDGAYLGDTEGYFVPHEFEITEPLASRSEHVLAVEVTCTTPSDRDDKRNITGVFQDWDCGDASWNPGGIWRPVRIEETGPIRIRELSARCTHADADHAVVAFSAVLDATDTAASHVRTVVGSVDHDAELELAAGPNSVEWTVTIDRPALWWPHALGEPHLETVVVEVRVPDAAGSRVSDRKRLRTGLRTVSMKRWTLSVNGERLFCKGTNLGPARLALGEATPEQCRSDIAAARELGLDLVRMHAHVARQETYDAADELGMLVWQDFPLQRGHARTIRKQAVRQARAMVDLLGHRPSIALWCGHNDPMGADGSGSAGAVLASLATQQRPTWNKTVLDRAVKRSIDRADGTRPVVKHSGVPPQLPAFEGTDSHLRLGWSEGDERELPVVAQRVPSLMRFPTAFGAQAVPDSDDFLDPARWPALDWERLASAHGAQGDILLARVPADGHDYESWKAATQRYQAELIRHHIETLRRLKYRPTGGFCQYLFADAHPAVSFSVLDHERRPKAGHAALAAACRSVIVVADRPPASVRPGTRLELDVHVVSDLRTDLTGTVEVTARWPGGDRRWAFQGDVPADSCVRVGNIDLVVPEVTGALTISLEGRVGDEAIDNAYRTTVTA